MAITVSEGSGNLAFLLAGYTEQYGLAMTVLPARNLPALRLRHRGSRPGWPSGCL
jgi:hypothetical protein